MANHIHIHVGSKKVQDVRKPNYINGEMIKLNHPIASADLSAARTTVSNIQSALQQLDVNAMNGGSFKSQILDELTYILRVLN